MPGEMSGGAYYNENDPFAARWLRNLADAGEIMAGTVDERSIEDVRGDDVRSYRRCHFFAGIAGWDLALRLVGWPDDRPVWTGSCPCQPYSAAGKGLGDEDPRNLWPRFRGLVEECLPPVVLGEQVESADGRAWLSRVRSDLEAMGYRFGSSDLCAAGVSAPQRRQRLFWVADANSARRQEGFQEAVSGAIESRRSPAFHPGGYGLPGGLGGSGREGLARRSRQSRDDGPQLATVERASGDVGGLGRAATLRRAQECPLGGRGVEGGGPQGRQQRPWDHFDVVPCADGKSRRFEPGSFPVAPRFPGSMGQIGAYGNAIVPEVAAEFIRAYLDATS